MEEIHVAEFDASNFDAKDFVHRYRRRLPLNQLQKGLRDHHGATRQELVDLINEKYADFVSLSSKMQGVEKALKPLRSPLEESTQLTRNMHKRLGALLEQVGAAEQNLARIANRKEALTAYIENVKLLEKAKAAASQRWGNPQESDSVREHLTQENVARDLRKIRLNLRGAFGGASGSETAGAEAQENEGVSASPECQALLKEVAEFEKVFVERVRERLRNLVAAVKRSWEATAEGVGRPRAGPSHAELLAVANLSRALVILGHGQAVEAIFLEVFARQAFDAAVTACSAAGEAAEGSGAAIPGAGAVDLGPFFESLKTSLLSEDAPLRFLSRKLRGEPGADGEEAALLAVPSLMLVANSVVGPALQRVEEVWPNVFMPAFPDVFAANYVHAQNFTNVAKAMMSAAESASFEAGTVFVEFQKRWKTQVYFSLRTKEAAQKLEVAAQRSRAGNPASRKKPSASGLEFWLEVSVELVNLVETIWGGIWYLDVLYPKMVQLTVEMVSRYGKAVQSLTEVVDPSGTNPTFDPAVSPPSWPVNSLPARLARAAADLLQVESGLRHGREATGFLAEPLLKRLPARGLGGRVEEIARALLTETSAGLHPALEALEAVILKEIGAAVAPQFAAIRGIPAFYRMLNKPVPTKASPYVDSALRPLQAFRQMAVGVAPAASVDGWVSAAVDAAAVEFGVQAAALLESMQQQEASFRRLAGRGGAGGDSQVSDLEKIHIQLCLDVTVFTEAAVELGVLASVPGLQRLSEVIEPIRAVFETHRPT